MVLLDRFWLDWRSQDPLALIQTVLPLPISVLADRLKIVFAGKDFNRLRSYKVLMVSRARVRAALDYLRRHSPFYRDIAVDEKALETLPDGDGAVPPELLARVVELEEEDAANVQAEGTGYVREAVDNDEEDNCGDEAGEAAEHMALHAVGVVLPDGVTSARELHGAAIAGYQRKVAASERKRVGPGLDADEAAEEAGSVATDDAEFQVQQISRAHCCAVVDMLWFAVGGSRG